MSEREKAPRLPPVDPATAAHVPASALTPELLASLLADGDDELAGWTLQHALTEAPRAVVFDGLLNDAMTLVGERWASGRWSVAEEHLASGTLLRTLERIRPALGPERRMGPLAVLAALPGERHAIGLVCLEQVLAEDGWSVANLGADVPVDDLAQFVAKREPQVVALTASHADRLPLLAETVTAIRSAGSGVPIMLGGRLALQPTLHETYDVAWSGTSLRDALAFARSIEPAHAASTATDLPTRP